MAYIQLPLEVPTNNQIVWIRLQRWAGAPFLAQWNAQQQSFEDQTNNIDYPVYAVAYWKPQ